MLSKVVMAELFLEMGVMYPELKEGWEVVMACLKGWTRMGASRVAKVE